MKAFGNWQQSGSDEGGRKMKIILYNQKELISFIVSFAQILETLEKIE